MQTEESKQNSKIVGDDEYYNKKTSLEELQEYCNVENTKAIKNIIAFISE